jgi:hypothetical protein
MHFEGTPLQVMQVEARSSRDRDGDPAGIDQQIQPPKECLILSRPKGKVLSPRRVG